MQDKRIASEARGSPLFLLKAAHLQIEQFSAANACFARFYKVYFNFLRKIFLSGYICLVCLLHGLSVELNRVAFDWKAASVIELVLLFAAAVDILLLQFYLINFKGWLSNTIFILYACAICSEIGLKLWGPPKEEFSAIFAANCLRIVIAVFVVFVFDDKYPFVLSGGGEVDLRVYDKVTLETQKPLKESSVVIRHSKRPSILKTPVNRNSMELSESKVMEEINICIRKIVQSKRNNEIIVGQSNLYKTFSEGLSKILDDDFNIFRFDENCLKHSLYTLMNYYYKYYQFDQIKVPEARFLNLAFNMEKSYNDNPYHSSVHAADVANTIYYLLERSSFIEVCEYSQMDILILLLSGAAHDIDHPGNNNAFEINNRSILAFTYNDKSVLENYHLYVFFNLLSNNFMNIFENYDMAQVKNFRRLIISNIISTDMLLHKAEVKKFTDMQSLSDFNPKKQETKEYIMTHLLHFSDISNPTKTFDVYNLWVKKIFIEFFTQGDKEKELGLPVSFNCDRTTVQIPGSQVFFMNFFILEELNLLINLAPKAVVLREMLEENKKKFEELKGQPYSLE